MADPSADGGDLFDVITADPAIVISVLMPGGIEINAGNAVRLWVGSAKVGAGYGDRTRLTGLGSQDITTMLSPRLSASRS